MKFEDYVFAQVQGTILHKKDFKFQDTKAEIARRAQRIAHFFYRDSLGGVRFAMEFEEDFIRIKEETKPFDGVFIREDSVSFVKTQLRVEELKQERNKVKQYGQLLDQLGNDRKELLVDALSIRFGLFLPYKTPLSSHIAMGEYFTDVSRQLKASFPGVEIADKYLYSRFVFSLNDRECHFSLSNTDDRRALLLDLEMKKPLVKPDEKPLMEVYCTEQLKLMLIALPKMVGKLLEHPDLNDTLLLAG